MGMKIDLKAATGIAVALVGLGTAGGLALRSHGDSTPSPVRQVQQVADTAAAPVVTPSATSSTVRLVKPAVANDAPITVDPTTTSPEPALPAPTAAPEPVAPPTLVAIGPGTVDS